MTMTLISTNTVGSGGTSAIIFSSIPSTFTDLLVCLSIRSDGTFSTPDVISIQFNSDTTSGNYNGKALQGSGSGTSSFNANGFFIYAADAPTTVATADVFSNSNVYIPNYSGSIIKHASTDSLSENNATLAYSTLVATYWNNTAAISSIRIFSSNGRSLVQNSSVSLYGILKGVGGATVS
jgi:hypothetical protein